MYQKTLARTQPGEEKKVLPRVCSPRLVSPLAGDGRVRYLIVLEGVHYRAWGRAVSRRGRAPVLRVGLRWREEIMDL